MPAGSVHFSSRAPVGHVVIGSEPLATNQGFKSLVPAAGILNSFVYYYLIGSREYARSRASGTTFIELSAKAFGELAIPVPPTNEQHRVVSKVEELFSELDVGIASLRDARAQLATYHQSLLKQAFAGKLTADWRERNTDVRPARYVLTEGKFMHTRSAANFVADRPSIPDTWCWATVDQLLSERLSNGRSVKSAQKGFPVLRLTALRNGSVVQNEYKIGAWTADDAERFLIREGDFLVSRGNGTLNLVGIGSLVRSVRFPVAYPDTMIRFRLCEHVDREFFCLVWNSPIIRRQLEARARTTAGIFKVNQHDLETTLIPLPPRNEQSAIAAIIQHQLATFDRTAVLIDNQRAKANTIRHSILKKAFNGRLVAQDPSDEPASVLLDRIRADRAQVAKRGTPRKAGKRRMSITAV